MAATCSHVIFTVRFIQDFLLSLADLAIHLSNQPNCNNVRLLVTKRQFVLIIDIIFRRTGAQDSKSFLRP